MAVDLCPHCRRPMPRQKVAKPYTAVDTATLSTDELFAYYKRIGTREDCRFWLSRARAIPDAIRAEGDALLAELETRDGKPADAKRLLALKMRAACTPGASVYPCGHRHTALSTAVACYAGVPIPPEGDTPEYRAEREALLAALGWTGYHVRKSEDSANV